jgi:hypothetical protein
MELSRSTAASSDKEGRGDVEKEFEAFFGEGDQVELTDSGHRIQEFSATFDLTKRSDPAE